jgi:hypothetical protein
MRLRPLEAALLASSLPGQTQRLLGRIERDDLRLHVRHDQLDEALRGLSRMVSRLAVAVLAGAMAISLAVIYSGTEGTTRRIVAALFALGFMATAGVILMILVSLWRGTRN